MNQELLWEVPFFKGLDESERASVAEKVTVEERAGGEMVFSCGDPPSCFYVIESGSVEIRIPASAVQEERRIELGGGDFFGEMGVIRGRSRMADASTRSDTVLLRIDQNDFDELLESAPAIAAKVTGALRERVGEFRRTEEASAQAIGDPHVLLFVSPGGHEGATFLTANLAPKIQALAPGKILVIDLNVANPEQPRFLGALSQQGSYAQVFEEGDATPAKIKAAASELPLGFDLLAGSGTGSIALTPEHLSTLLPKAAEVYDYVLVDAGAEPLAHLLSVARLADAVHVVLEATEASASRARDLAGKLRGEGLDGRIRFVLNRLGDSPELDPEALEYDLGDEIVGRISVSGVQEKLGAGPGVPVVTEHPQSQVSTEFSRLARTLLCLPTGEADTVKSFSLWSWFTS